MDKTLKIIRSKYEDHFLLYDYIISLFLTIFIIIIFIFSCEHDLDNFINEYKNNVYPLITSLSGTMLGFIITGVSILIALFSTESLMFIRKYPIYSEITKVYLNAIFFLSVNTILSIMGIIINHDIKIILLYFILLFSIVSIFRVGRCIWILYCILDIIKNPKLKTISKRM